MIAVVRSRSLKGAIRTSFSRLWGMPAEPRTARGNSVGGCPSVLIMAYGVRQTRKSGHEVIQHGQAGQPGSERITPLSKPRVGETDEDFGYEEKSCDENQNREHAQKELHPIAKLQPPITHHERPDSPQDR